MAVGCFQFFFQTSGSGRQISANSGCLPDMQYPAFPDFRTGFRHIPNYETMQTNLTQLHFLPRSANSLECQSLPHELTKDLSSIITFKRSLKTYRYIYIIYIY